MHVLCTPISMQPDIMFWGAGRGGGAGIRGGGVGIREGDGYKGKGSWYKGRGVGLRRGGIQHQEYIMNFQ